MAAGPRRLSSVGTAHEARSSEPFVRGVALTQVELPQDAALRIEERAQAVRFEHLVEVNDLKDPCAARVTRAQLWRGLVLRAEEPTSFVPQLSEATILARTESGLARALRFGAVTVTDEVSFVHLERVRYEIAAQADLTASSLTMHIEEPRPGSLFVRFTYEDDARAEDAVLDALRCAAYEDADVETVGMIRWLAKAGRLDGQ